MAEEVGPLSNSTAIQVAHQQHTIIEAFGDITVCPNNIGLSMRVQRTIKNLSFVRQHAA